MWETRTPVHARGVRGGAARTGLRFLSDVPGLAAGSKRYQLKRQRTMEKGRSPAAVTVSLHRMRPTMCSRVPQKDDAGGDSAPADEPTSEPPCDDTRAPCGPSMELGWLWCLLAWRGVCALDELLRRRAELRCCLMLLDVLLESRSEPAGMESLALNELNDASCDPQEDSESELCASALSDSCVGHSVDGLALDMDSHRLCVRRVELSR